MNSGRADSTDTSAAKGARVAIVQARYNPEIGEKLVAGATQALAQHGVQHELFKVPGAFELPLLAQRLFATKRFDGLVAIGVVIRGDTPHFDYVCDAVTAGLNRVQLDASLPIGFGVITTNNLQQALDRAGGKDGNKGGEAAEAVIEMVSHLRQIK